DGIPCVSEHPQLAATTDEQALEQIVVLFVITRSALFVPLQLLASQFPRFLINDRWDFNRDPFFSRASDAAGIVFARWSVARHISALGRNVLTLVVIVGAGVDRVAQQIDDRATAPALFATPRADAQFIEAFVDLISGELLIDQPAEDHPHDFRLGLVDDEFAGTVLRARDIGITVRRFAHPDLPLASAMQTASAAALGNQGAFVFGEDAGHFLEHPLRRRSAEVVAGENDFATGPFELLNDDVLIGELSGEAIGRENQHGFHFALRHGVAQTIQRGPIQTSAAVAVVLVNVLRADVIIVLTRVFLNSGNL